MSTRTRIAAVAATALLCSTAPALATVGVTAPLTLNGGTVSQIPPITLTSTLAAGTTIDWTITGPGGFSIDGTGASPLALPAQDPGTDCPVTTPATLCYTLAASDTGVAPFPAIATFSVDRTPPNPPTVTSGPPAETGPAGPFTFAWTKTDPTATSSRWQLRDRFTVVAEGTTTATQITVPPPTLSPGDRVLNFRVSLRDSLLNESAFASWHTVLVDQTPPPAPAGLAGPAGTIRTLNPSFSWVATEAGATFEWNVTDAAGRSVVPAGTVRATANPFVTTPRLILPASRVNALTFRVRQVDVHGNRGPEVTAPLTISTLAACAAPTRWQAIMRPTAGSSGVGLRPLLRWHRLTARTTQYAVTISRGSSTIALFQKFTKRTHLLVPKGTLRRGTKYTWRVFSYIGVRPQSAVMTSCFITRR